MNISTRKLFSVNSLSEALNHTLRAIVSTVNTHALLTETTTSNNQALPYMNAKVVQVRLETHDTKTYFFNAESQLKKYKAGAHINIEFIANGETIKRTYTLSSSPSPAPKDKPENEFSITVKRVNDGLASNWLFENLNEGDTIKASQAQGNFVLPYQPAGKILMLSAGSGITPLMSMLRYLAQAGNQSNIKFLNYAQSPTDIIFHNELEELSEKNENIDTKFSVERGIEPSSDKTHNIHTGRITKRQITKLVPDILEREIYLCGPQAFMKATVEILDKLKFNPSQLHLENFTADLSAATQLGYSAKLSFASLDKSIQSSPSKTILEEAESVGLKPAAACRTGICRTCRCKKTSGTTVNLITGEESTDSGDYILPCVSVAKTTTRVEL